jgi:hypothetical protein
MKTSFIEPGYRIVPLAFAIVFLCMAITPFEAQSTPDLLNAPWRGFDTGIFDSGFGPASFAAGDLDGDNDFDLLVGDSYFGSTGISVLRSNGDKTFQPPVFYPLAQGQTVGEVALSDFDLDGDLDAFATIRGDFDQLLKIKVWRNAGNGIFSPPVEFATGQGPVGITVADFTGDGKPDVATANFGGSSISILKHNGMSGASAGFLAPVTIGNGNQAEKIVTADLNGDNAPDIVAGCRSGGVSASLIVFLNTGTGDFAPGVSYDAAPGGDLGSTAVALADLDNDGDVDLIGGGSYTTGSVNNGAATIRRNTGSGAFGAADVILFSNFVSYPKALATGHINSDGFADIVAAVPSGRANEGFVAINSNGLGSFSAPIYYEASQQTFDVRVLDVDADGDRDVLTLANSSAAVTVHENPGNGAFRVLTRNEVASLSDAIDSADIDHDGDVDIVVNGEVDIASNDAIVKILKNNGDGTFAPAIDYSPPRNFADMKLRDINGDGFVDLLFAPDGNYPSYHFGTALNLGNGSFAPTVVRQVFACGEGTIDAADLDNDGDRDIVLTEEESCIGSAPNRVFIMRNDGGQSFVQMPDVNVAGLPSGLALADVTGDGKIDVISALSTGMGVYPGNGDLTFGAAITSTTRPYRFKMADFDRDGKLDVGMIMQQDSFGTDTIATARGNGNGTFQAIRTQTGSSVLENLRISGDLETGDVNVDGIPDIVTFNYASNDVSVFLGNPDGTLRPHQRYGIGNAPLQGTLADLDGNGSLDVAAAISLPPSGLHNAVVVLRNELSNRRTPFDFDGDGKTDIGIFRPLGGEWWINRSSTGVTFALQFGASTDKITPVDYTGDGKADIAFFRPASGEWYVLRSEDFSFFALPFGTSGDVPVPADYDADGKADFAVFRPSSSTWYLSQSSGAPTRIQQFGITGDQPVVADYDADGRADIGIFRPGPAEWWIQRSTTGLLAMQFGASTDKPVQGDYTGDGKADVAIWRPTTGEWFIVRSEDSSFYGFPFGTNGDVPSPGDYDGDGKFDAAVFRPSGATWFVARSTAGTHIVQFGANGDRPLPNAFVP